MPDIRFLLNGEPRAGALVSPTMTVLDWLRLNARLTGTKEGCAEGDCGACTIVLGRAVGGKLHYRAVNSCLMMLPQVHGCAVLTVDGVAAPDGTLHPVQQALRDNFGLQCGFCTPGVVMTLAALTQGDAKPSAEALEKAMSGHICRCTGYQGIRRAIRQLAGEAA
jgi:xanthine dehydrogenase small subunit